MTGPLPGSGSTVSVLVAIAIVVADMIGVGVFTSLGFQVKDIPSGFSILLLWTVGGVVALCGVFSYSELGAMFPRSSGEYNFLSRAYHPAFGFLAGFVSATVGFSAPVALAAMAFGEYGRAIAPHLARLGSRQVWAGSPQVMVTGPQAEAWDLAFIVEYPGSQAFIDMVRDPDYRENVVPHRSAAVADSRLLRLAPLDPDDKLGH